MIEFTEEQTQRMVTRYLGGESLMSISFDYGVCQDTVGARLKERGVKLRPKGRRRKFAKLEAQLAAMEG